MRRVESVYLFTNGMVCVFDEAGEQITELQGMLNEMREKILTATDEKTVWYYSKWQTYQNRITRQQFELAQQEGYSAVID